MLGECRRAAPSLGTAQGVNESLNVGIVGLRRPSKVLDDGGVPLDLVSPDLGDQFALAPLMLAMISETEAGARLRSAGFLQPVAQGVVGHAA